MQRISDSTSSSAEGPDSRNKDLWPGILRLLGLHDGYHRQPPVRADVRGGAGEGLARLFAEAVQPFLAELFGGVGAREGDFRAKCRLWVKSGHPAP